MRYSDRYSENQSALLLHQLSSALTDRSDSKTGLCTACAVVSAHRCLARGRRALIQQSSRDSPGEALESRSTADSAGPISSSSTRLPRQQRFEGGSLPFLYPYFALADSPCRILRATHEWSVFGFGPCSPGCHNPIHHRSPRMWLFWPCWRPTSWRQC